MTTKKKPSPTDEKSSALASRPKQQTAQPTPQSADGATLADILAVLERIDAKLGALMPKPLEKL